MSWGVRMGVRVFLRSTAYSWEITPRRSVWPDPKYTRVG